LSTVFRIFKSVMIKFRTRPLTLCLGLVLAVTQTTIGLAAIPASTLAQVSSSTPSLAPMLEKVTPAVVNIATKGKVRVKDNPLFRDPFFRYFFDQPSRPRFRETQSLGSGVIVDAKNGYIITNNHVISGADEIAVTLVDQTTRKATLIGTDPDTDIAVIRVAPEGLSALTFADSEKLRVGDFVVAIGNPFGLGQTVTSGIVSALGRSGLGIEGYEDFIQTDASINPGNSGGALVDLEGKLVGINTAILSPNGSGNVGIGFAIPINLAYTIMEQLVLTGEVKRGRLGIVTQDFTPELAQAFNIKEQQGAVVSQVIPGSPADKIGLRAGDVITTINGRKIQNSDEARNVIGLLRSGQDVHVFFIRNGKKQKVIAQATSIERVKAKGEEISAILAGSTLSAVKPDSPFAVINMGIEVERVSENSNAWLAGLRKGDIIIAANRTTVNQLSELRDAIKQNEIRLLLNIVRNGEAILLLVQ